MNKSYDAGLNTGASLWCKVDTDRSTKPMGTFNPQRVTTSSSFAFLSGRQQMFVVAYIAAIKTPSITIRPIFIGHRLLVDGSYHERYNYSAKIQPAAIDQWKNVNFGLRLSTRDLEVLRGVPEAQIKANFAAILGEPDVPADWGGEQFDLWTSRLTVSGSHLQAAIMFKGPAAFRPMTIAELGKNGDQIDRLSQTAADLLVVQHCHSITAPVVNMLKAYALAPRNPRRYMTIDGYDTIRIFRHFGYLRGSSTR